MCGLGFTARLSGLASKVELEGFAAELIDRFGKLPSEVNTLAAGRSHQGRVQEGGHCAAGYRAQRGDDPVSQRQIRQPRAGWWTFIEDQRGLAKVKDNKIVVRRDWSRTKDRVQGAFAVARDLAAHARG